APLLNRIAGGVNAVAAGAAHPGGTVFAEGPVAGGAVTVAGQAGAIPASAVIGALGPCSLGEGDGGRVAGPCGVLGTGAVAGDTADGGLAAPGVRSQAVGAVAAAPRCQLAVAHQATFIAGGRAGLGAVRRNPLRDSQEGGHHQDADGDTRRQPLSTALMDRHCRYSARSPIR